MKNLIFLVLIFLLSGCFSGFVMNLSDKDLQESQNVLSNPSFEDGLYSYESIPPNWMVMDKPSNTVFWDKEVANGGEKSLKIQRPLSSVKIISDSFPIDPGAVYYVQASVKTDNITSKQVALEFFVFDKEGNKLNVFKRKFYVQDKWTKLKLTAGFFKSNAKFARVIVIIPRKPDVTFWVDDINAYNIHSFMKRK